MKVWVFGTRNLKHWVINWTLWVCETCALARELAQGFLKFV